MMDAFFLQMELEISGGFYPYYPHRLMEYILCLAKHGLQWNGENANIRQVLRRLDKYDQMKLLLAISEARAIIPKALKALISTPAIRDLMKAYPIEARAISKAAGIRSLNMMIVNWVRDGVSSASEIAAKMGSSKGMVSRRAARLIEAGCLAKKGRGVYKLGPNANALVDDLDRI